MSEQNEQEWQDSLWDHYQKAHKSVFDLSYPRLDYLSKQCGSTQRVLNIGIGSGYLERKLHSRGVEVYAIDPSPASVKGLRTELHTDSRVKVGHCHDIPYPDEYFDVVIMSEVLEHLQPDRLQESLDEVRRVLNFGGKFMGTVPFNEVLQDGYVICPKCRSEFHRWGHMNSFDKESLRTTIESSDFRIIRLSVRAFSDFSRRSPKPLLRALFREVLGRLGEKIVNPSLYFMATKKSSRRDRVD